MTKTIFHANVAGFFGSFASLTELRTWANARKTANNLTGQTLTILQGTSHNGVDTFEPDCPSKTITL